LPAGSTQRNEKKIPRFGKEGQDLIRGGRIGCGLPVESNMVSVGILGIQPNQRETETSEGNRPRRQRNAGTVKRKCGLAAKLKKKNRGNKKGGQNRGEQKISELIRLEQNVGILLLQQVQKKKGFWFAHSQTPLRERQKLKQKKSNKLVFARRDLGRVEADVNGKNSKPILQGGSKRANGKKKV